ncbi:dihydrofolate reductase [Pontibacter sp. Tf4]|uniref:dihydrofolate reductase family protein n=1 Tax=Pontibacter sp. Tf4 TaxID=2761620 RepID=UPI001628A72A|nr:dihydrofolate reductase family protein [Pontibacter sp. Tf4]MBB6611452.1 dihydrofolate reductase [Pontibacter sp. Tf4]
MRKIVLYIAASLDGYIARPDGSIDWLEDDVYKLEGEDYGYNSFRQTIDTTLMGNNTYKVVKEMGMPFPYQDKKNYVFTRSSHPKADFVEFVQEDPVAFVKQLKKQEGKDIWLIGGAQLNMQLLNASLVDEMIITFVPLILGRGIPLFAGGVSERKMKVHDVSTYQNGFVQVNFKL